MKDLGSQLIKCSILSTRSQASGQTIVLIGQFKNHLHRFDLTNCYLRSDNEFRTQKLKQFCDEDDIAQEFTFPGHSYQNGAAENDNDWLVRKVQKLLFEAALTRRFWSLALQHAVFLYNSRSSAYERFHRKEYNFHPDKLVPFGSRVFIRNNNNIKKINKSLKASIFLGYDNTIKIIHFLNCNLANRKVVILRLKV
ncbi:unnamed protein product [Ambrosiozyma monospora]|uniref:Unnamed protein product n=1 Tax=Ambrosiozyma monospora TaxID=43982 RepID=A0A9W6YKG4_AMBMO|nr:unnamed protein product [Ambrosiozyma monospora]